MISKYDKVECKDQKMRQIWDRTPIADIFNQAIKNY